MTQISSIANIKKEGLPKAPEISGEKEFKKIIQSIRKIAAGAKASVGDAFYKFSEKEIAAADRQKQWKLIGSAGPLVGPLAAVFASEGKAQFAAKVAEVAQNALNTTSLSYDAERDERRQLVTGYNSFDQALQSLVQSMNSELQRQQQSEMEKNRL